LRGVLYECGNHFDKIGEIGLKPALVEHWLATFIVTCTLGRAVSLNQIPRALLSFVTNLRLFEKPYYVTGHVG